MICGRLLGIFDCDWDVDNICSGWAILSEWAMRDFNRRTVLGMSAGALSVLHFPRPAAAQPQPACVPSGRPEFLPARFTIDCASRRHVQVFRKNTGYLGLSGP